MTRPVMNQMFMLMMMTQEIPKHLFCLFGLRKRKKNMIIVFGKMKQCDYPRVK